MVFFSMDYNIREKSRRLLNKYIKELGFELLGYREVPVNNAGVGPSALEGERKIEQVFVKPAHAPGRYWGAGKKAIFIKKLYITQ
jgi:glutamate synthase (NADPH/NADH) large chain